MTAKTDIIKGRIKEAAGVLTGNRKLRAEGQADQALGKIKQVAKHAVSEAKVAANTAVGKVKQAARKTVGQAKYAAKKSRD